MEVQISERGGAIIGARIENYLLEKVRVVQQSPGERSFHAFYQLFSSSWAPNLSLSTPDQCRYLAGSGCYEADNIDDVDEFNDVNNAFVQMGLRKRRLDLFSRQLLLCSSWGTSHFYHKGKSHE